jgi:hypothetical protein
MSNGSKLAQGMALVRVVSVGLVLGLGRSQ